MNNLLQNQTTLPDQLMMSRIIQEELNHFQESATLDRSQYFQLHWVRSGKGTVTIDLESYDIIPDIIYCISPGQIQQFSDTEDLLIDCISFTGEFLGRHDDLGIISNSGLFRTYGSIQMIQINGEVIEILTETLHQMQAEYAQFNQLRTEIMRSLLRTFLLYLSRQSKNLIIPPSQNRNSELVKKFMLLLEKNYTFQKMVIDYADVLAVTPNYLNEVVKRVTGYPASYHIHQRIALEAKRQAVYEALSMKEVAFSLGFQDIAHFSKYFKRVVGINFSDYKKDYANQLQQ